MTNNAPFASVADVQSHFVSAGANRIHYVTAGKGSRAVVFVMAGRAISVSGANKLQLWRKKRGSF
jgi:hypothetical protein